MQFGNRNRYKDSGSGSGCGSGSAWRSERAFDLASEIGLGISVPKMNPSGSARAFAHQNILREKGPERRT